MSSRRRPQRPRTKPKRRLTNDGIRAFHDILRSGDVSLALLWLVGDPRLAWAKDQGGRRGITSLMVATQCPRALELIGLLLSKNAPLTAHNDLRQTVLHHACAHGVDIEIIQHLLQWNGLRHGDNQLSWTHCDATKRTPLELACAEGHVDLVARILETLPTVDVAVTKLLRAAINTREEALVLGVLTIPRVEETLANGDRGWGPRSCGGDLVKTLLTRRMFDALRGLHRLQAHEVEDAVDYRTQVVQKNRISLVGLPTDIVQMAKRPVRMKIWKTVGPIVMFRYHHCRRVASDASEAEQPRAFLARLSRLPDDAFAKIIAFARPRVRRSTHRILV